MHTIKITEIFSVLKDRRFFILIIFLLSSFFYYHQFLQTGHFAGTYFRIFSIIEFLFSLCVNILFFKYRFFGAALAGILFPRFFQIVTGLEGHSTLFPYFTGLSFAVLLKAVFDAENSRFREKYSLKDALNGRSLMILASMLYLSILLLREWISNYGFGLLDFPFRDREVSPGVSANLSMHHSLTAALNLFGPLLWIFTEKIFFLQKESSMQNQIMAGFTAGAAFNICVMLIQSFTEPDAFLFRFYKGTAKSFEVGRLPGFFSDSGSSAALMPVLFYISYIYIKNNMLKQNIIYSKILSSGVFLIVLVSAGIYQGRGYFLVSSAVLLILFLHLYYFSFLVLNKNKREMLYASVFIFASGMILLYLIKDFTSMKRILGAFPGIVEAIANYNLYDAFMTLDSERTRLFLVGLNIFYDHVLIGSGLNTFVRESSFYRTETMISHDNSANLYIGALSDTGIVGTLIVLLMLALYGYFLYLYLEKIRTGEAGGDLLKSFEIFMIPGIILVSFLFGYHIVHPETAVVFFLPLFCCSFREEGKRLRAGMYFNVLIYFLIILYVIIYFAMHF
ncbi:MAG: O-antigen ligase family protein [Spirochaetia bacterium]|nr:O-antigen ligase family protein [Spirochaetia bacterium]